jgi:hypothetical protein
MTDATTHAPQPSTRVLAQLGSDLARYYTRGQGIERRCYRLAALLSASGVFHLGVQAVDRAGRLMDRAGVVAKACHFGTSFGLTLATITWVTAFLPIRERTRGRLLGGFAAACTLEVAVITTQAWRGVPSHFNLSTTFNAAMAYSAAAGGAVTIGTTLAFAVAWVAAAPQYHRACGWLCGWGSPVSWWPWRSARR